MFQHVTTGVTFTTYMEVQLKKYLPSVIYIGLGVGLVFSLMYAGAAIAFIAMWVSSIMTI